MLLRVVTQSQMAPAMRAAIVAARISTAGEVSHEDEMRLEQLNAAAQSTGMIICS